MTVKLCDSCGHRITEQAFVCWPCHLEVCRECKGKYHPREEHTARERTTTYHGFEVEK